MNVEKSSPGALDLGGKIAVVFFLLAGIIHLVIIPQQWEHAPAHGIFMAVSGIVEIGWAIVFYRRPSKAFAEYGIMIAVALIVLWIFSRIFIAPFSGGPEEIDLAGVATKLLEGASTVLLARYLAQAWINRRWLAQSILSLVLLGVMMGMGTYLIARASQPFLPGLASPDSQNMPMQMH
jgi:hypothetical protein